MQSLIALLLVPAVYCAAFGWGRLLERALYARPPGHSAYTVALGLLAWLGIGAILNGFSLARPIAFDLLIGSGIVLAALHWRCLFQPGKTTRLSGETVPLLITLLLTAVFAWSLLPTSVFNIHDDFVKYLPRVARMLQTGTLIGDPYDLIGIDGLGMHSFLQGLFVAHLPLDYINGFDTVFCLMLAGLLIEQLGRTLGAHWAMRSLAVIAVMTLNAQYVNIAPLYAGVALIIAMGMATLSFGQSVTAGAASSWRAALPIGLFGAAIAGLKVTFIPYAVSFLLVLLALSVAHPVTRSRVVKPAFAAALAALALYAAWAAPHAPKLLELVLLTVERVESAVPPLATAAASTGPSYLRQILRARELLYGGHLFQYLAMLAIIGALAGMATLLLFRSAKGRGVALAAATSGITALVSTVCIFFTVYGIHVNAMVRYNAPVLVAVLPMLCLLLYAAADRVLGAGRQRTATALGLAAALLIPTLSQAGVFAERVRLAFQEHHLLGFPLSVHSQAKLGVALSAEDASRARELQDLIPAGATILAWTNLSFNLDFNRNRIYLLASATLFRGIDRVTGQDQPDWLQRRLRLAGVEYVIWRRDGTLPKWGKHHKTLVDSALDRLSRHSRQLHADPRFVVFAIRPTPADPGRMPAPRPNANDD